MYSYLFLLGHSYKKAIYIYYFNAKFFFKYSLIILLKMVLMNLYIF
jgi:hypothetical protein